MNAKESVNAESATFLIATRGSALAMAQAHEVLRLCQNHFPERRFELKVIRTTGDKLQSASMANPDPSLPKGLFTKELEVALLNRQADLAVHSLKDLPTELPEGLCLAGVLEREDVRDVMVYRGKELAREWDSGRTYAPNLTVQALPQGATIATSSTRRKMQVLAKRPDLKVVEIRGNVGTRLRKIAESRTLDATLLACAGMKRLGWSITDSGELVGKDVPSGLFASLLPTQEMMPCVGQAAIALESAESNECAMSVCKVLNHFETLCCVTAERAFLRQMGGGCQSPVAAYATVEEGSLVLQAVSFQKGYHATAQDRGPLAKAKELGQQLAEVLS